MGRFYRNENNGNFWSDKALRSRWVTANKLSFRRVKRVLSIEMGERRTNHCAAEALRSVILSGRSRWDSFSSTCILRSADNVEQNGQLNNRQHITPWFSVDFHWEGGLGNPGNSLVKKRRATVRRGRDWSVHDESFQLTGQVIAKLKRVYVRYVAGTLRFDVTCQPFYQASQGFINSPDTYGQACSRCIRHLIRLQM